MSPRTTALVQIGLVTVVSSLILWLATGFSVATHNFDGPYYGVVARCGYDKVCIGESFSFPLPLEYYAAHLPLYPWLLRIFSTITHTNLLTGAVLLTVMTSILYAGIVYLIWEKMKWKHGLFVAVTSLFFWPRMWVVRSVGSPETLFLTGIVLSLFFFEKKKYLLAGIFGAIATLTKSPGVLLFAGYGLWFVWEAIKTKKFHVKIWPVLLIPLALVGLFGLYQLQMQDFWAYFHSGDNIHLQLLPFKVFDSTQSWVGTFWLEDILWVYLIGGLGTIFAFRKSRVWGWFGIVFFVTILFVSHRDISRYSLPLVPVVLLGFSELFTHKELRVGLALLLIPMFFYSINFMTHNALAIGDLTPFFLK